MTFPTFQISKKTKQGKHNGSEQQYANVTGK